MNLGKTNNVIQLQKGLYARELYQYSYLCKDYLSLAEILRHSNPNTTAFEVEKKYGKFLAKAASGNISFPSDSLNNLEINILHDYAKHAKYLAIYKEASIYISNALQYKDGKIILDKTSLNKYFSFIKNTPHAVLKNFHNFNKNNCYSIAGHRNYQLTLNSLYSINRIDSSHFSEDVSTLNINLTPSAFGAKISGYKKVNQISKNSRNLFENYEPKYFMKNNTTSSKAVKVFKGQKNDLSFAHNVAIAFSVGTNIVNK